MKKITFEDAPGKVKRPSPLILLAEPPAKCGRREFVKTPYPPASILTPEIYQYYQTTKRVTFKDAPEKLRRPAPLTLLAEPPAECGGREYVRTPYPPALLLNPELLVEEEVLAPETMSLQQKEDYELWYADLDKILDELEGVEYEDESPLTVCEIPVISLDGQTRSVPRAKTDGKEGLRSPVDEDAPRTRAA